MAQQKNAPEPEGFRPIEVTPPTASESWAPIEVPAQAAPVAEPEKPATGSKEH